MIILFGAPSQAPAHKATLRRLGVPALSPYVYSTERAHRCTKRLVVRRDHALPGIFFAPEQALPVLQHNIGIGRLHFGRIRDGDFITTSQLSPFVEACEKTKEVAEEDALASSRKPVGHASYLIGRQVTCDLFGDLRFMVVSVRRGLAFAKSTTDALMGRAIELNMPVDDLVVCD